MSAPAVAFLVGTTAGHLLGLLALRDVLDNHFGPYPIASVDSWSGAVDATFMTTHHVTPIAHPVTAGEYMIPLSLVVRAVVNATVAVCAAAVSGGTATAAQSAIAGLPAQVSALGASWFTGSAT